MLTIFDIFDILKIKNTKQKLSFNNNRFYAYDNILLDNLTKTLITNLTPLDNNNLLSKQLNIEFNEFHPLRIYSNNLIIYEEFIDKSNHNIKPFNSSFILYQYNKQKLIKKLSYGNKTIEKITYNKNQDNFNLIVYDIHNKKNKITQLSHAEFFYINNALNPTN